VCTVRAARSPARGRRTLDIVVAAESSHRALRLAHALRRALAADVCMRTDARDHQRIDHVLQKQHKARCASYARCTLPGQHPRAAPSSVTVASQAGQAAASQDEKQDKQ